MRPWRKGTHESEAKVHGKGKHVPSNVIAGIQYYTHIHMYKQLTITSCDGLFSPHLERSMGGNLF